MTIESVTAIVEDLARQRQEAIQTLFTIDGSLQAYISILEQLKAAAPAKES